jgi:hypothetical protein
MRPRRARLGCRSGGRTMWWMGMISFKTDGANCGAGAQEQRGREWRRTSCFALADPSLPLAAYRPVNIPSYLNELEPAAGIVLV